MKGYAIKLLLCFVIISGLYIIINPNTSLAKKVKKSLKTGEFITLEARYNPQDIIQANKNQLLKSPDYTLQEPDTLFHSYLLMKVKYATDPQNTKESFMLWSLHDGELVLDTHTWEKTKGFEECINVKATASNFLLIKLLNQRSEGLSKEQLKKLLVLDNKQLEDILHDTTQKKLILYQNGLYRLHFQNPKFNVPPQTSFFNKLVQKSYKGTTHLSSQYSSSEVSNIAKAAFGSSLHIKKSYEICIPIYRISILNPDGSIYNTFWNALNGKEIKTNLLAL